MSTAGKLLAATLVVVLGACGGDDDAAGSDDTIGSDACVGCPPGFADMTEAEHRDAACEGIDEIRGDVAAGNLRVTGDQLDDITNHARASGDEALDEAADDFAHGIADSDGEAVDAAARDLDELCT